MICIIDNYDSFSYNLYQYVGELAPVTVVKNDVSLGKIASLRPDALILSPGPGRPSGAGVCREALTRFFGKRPVLGVCLGHQVICEAFGARVDYADKIMHGKADRVYLASGSPIFAGLPPMIEAARYHSLAAGWTSLPDELLVIAETGAGEVMGVKHRDADVYGLQFHPESVLTPAGRTIIENFVWLAGASAGKGGEL